MNKKYIYIFVGSLVLFFVFIGATSPYKLPLLFIMFPALPLLLAVIALTRLVLGLLHVDGSFGRFITLFIALVCGVFAVLLSLGQLTFKDFFLLLALGLVGSFYILRMFKPSKDDE